MTTRWKLAPPSALASRLAGKAGLSNLEAQLLINRGVTSHSDALGFLDPRLSGLTDPMLLKDMDAALDLILETVENREPITVYGDYDADGLTSTALLLNVFSSIGVPVSYYIPNRLTEGYSLNPEALRGIARKGGLIITVDCGTGNTRELALAEELGMKVVVTDHHRVPEDFRPSCPFLNPHRPDSEFPFADLAGVGLAFFLAVALRRSLRERGWFLKNPEPDLRDYLDLVALGTVADMVPLLDQNRILVSAGIEKMRATQWPGLNAIQEIAEVQPMEMTSYDLAFRMAPRLNASGRMGEADTGLMALTTDDPSAARRLARQLNDFNLLRQSVEQQILREIEETIISCEELEGRKTLVLSGHGWHRGVLGIVASRLVDKYHRPTVVLDIRNGMATGSARSIEGFNLYGALTALGHLLERFGGHPQAAGLTLKASNIGPLREDLESLARKDLRGEDLVRFLSVDAEVTLPEMTMEAVNRIRSLAPFGAGNPEPLLCARELEVAESRVVGERHLKLRLKQGERILDAIGFGLAGEHPAQGRINAAFSPDIDRWRGQEKVQLKIIDLEASGGNSKLLQD